MNFCVPTFVFVQLIAHLFGDYFLQSDWMAAEKTKKSLAALAHALTYTLPFLLLAHSWQALVFIPGTHFVVDRWRLARYVCWIKNFRRTIRPSSRSGSYATPRRRAVPASEGSGGSFNRNGSRQ